MMVFLQAGQLSLLQKDPKWLTTNCLILEVNAFIKKVQGTQVERKEPRTPWLGLLQKKAKELTRERRGSDHVHITYQDPGRKA